MSLQQQMIAANIRNWLADLAIGAKAMNTTILCAPCDDANAYKYEAHTYDTVLRDGIVTMYIHNIKVVADVAELDLQHRKFKKDDFYYDSFVSEDFFVFNGVKFSGLNIRNGKAVKK